MNENIFLYQSNKAINKMNLRANWIKETSAFQRH